MENKFVVPYETAKLLKDKGYNEKISFAYNKDKELIRSGSLDLNNTDWERLHDIERIHSRYMYPPRISAPTYHEVIYWLEDQGYLIETMWARDESNVVWFCRVAQKNTNIYPTREEALNEAIVYALELM